MKPLDTSGIRKYGYQRLHPWQTRMINLLPGDSEDPLKCELVVADLILASKAVGIAGLVSNVPLRGFELFMGLA